VAKPLSEMFITVANKETQYDSFAYTSGDRLGSFHAEMPIPWHTPQYDRLGRVRPTRQVPQGYR